jgi:dimethylglycine dehydrogenase
MAHQARVAVIGGGIIGCGILYHLAKLGWTDSVLLERDELTAGATWHAAGNLSHYASSAFWTRIQKATTDLYETLARECGHDVGFHKAGSIRLATVPDHMVENRRAHAKARALGVEMELIGPAEIKRLFPFVELHDVLGGAFTPGCGSADPSSVTTAMASRARAMGATIRQGIKVTGLALRPGGLWRIETTQGTVDAEIVVNAAGMWAPEIAAMAGIRDLPFVIFLHQHLVTETSPEVAALPRRLPTLRDPIGGFNVRQEGMGLLSGVYEHEPVFWGVDGVPPAFGREVFPPDWDRSKDFLENAIKRVPLLGRLGIKMVYNAPTSRTPDHAPLIGPVPGLPNFFIAAGFAAGVMQAAASRLVAEWIAEGEPSLDPGPVDVRRYGSYATKAFAYAVVRAGHKFAGAVDYPYGERGTGRPGKASALHDRHKAARAVFGARNGWEVPLWFAPDGMDATEQPRFGRPNWFDAVGAECRALTARAGLLDRSSLAKLEVSGPGAAALLDRLSAARLPDRTGDVAIAPFLTEQGGIAALFTIVRMASERFLLTAPPEFEIRDYDHLARTLPNDGSVALKNMSARNGLLLLAGPRAAEILSRLTTADLSPAGFPWGTARSLSVGNTNVLAIRFNQTGEDGFELYHRLDAQLALYDALVAAGAECGLVAIGLRAHDALALECGHPARGLDFGLRSHPAEAGLESHVDYNKPDFVGRHAALSRRAAAGRLCRLLVEAGDSDAYLNDAVFEGSRAIALVGSGGYGHRLGQSLALAMLPTPLATAETALSVEILGERRSATVLPAVTHGEPRVGKETGTTLLRKNNL